MSSDRTIYARLAKIQSELKAPKGQVNKFGGYKYRSCEDILTAVKPLLGGLVLKIDDEVQSIGSRFYIQATASISDGEQTITSTAIAREEETKKGMDASQITGAASSYARKYALNGLLCIDDTTEADAHCAPEPERISESQITDLEALMDEVQVDGVKFMRWLKTQFKVGDLSELTVGAYPHVVEALERKRRAP